MINYLPEFLTVAALHFLAVMSPGPDFVLISRNSLAYSRKNGVYAALGLALGIMVHVIYCLVGIGYIISKSILIFSAIKLLGAGYLIYIGYKSLRAQPSKNDSTEVEHKDMGALASIKNGFLTDLLNPKTTLFFLALFTQVIKPNTPMAIKVAYGMEMSIMTFLWFAAVAIVLSHSRIKQPFTKVQHYMERFMGAALIVLGLKVALSKAK